MNIWTLLAAVFAIVFVGIALVDILDDWRHLRAERKWRRSSEIKSRLERGRW